MIIDTHCHLNEPCYDNDRDEIIKHFEENRHRMSAGCLQAGKLELSTTAPSEGEPLTA